MVKIPIHSVTDLITNSSTTIFTYSEGSEPAVIEMINELFESFGIDKKCEDVFDTVVLADEYQYSSYLEGLDEDDELAQKFKDIDINEFVEEVRQGKAEKPDWFKTVEELEDSWSYYTPDTYLHLIPKDKKYEKLAEKVIDFLYSTNHEATRDG